MPRIDYFRQASSDHAKSTVFGGIVSILCLTTIAWLLLSEVKVFLSTSIETSTTIQNNFDNQDYTILAINVTVFGTPCSILTVEFTNDVKMG